MPAISAAANPVAAIASASGTGKPASGPEEQRSFSTVLAEQSGKPPQAGNGGQPRSEETAAKSPSASEPGAIQTVASAAQPQPDVADTAPDALNTQIQAIAELMLATLPAPAGPVAPEVPPVAVAAPALMLAAAVGSDSPGPDIDGDFLARTVAGTHSATVLQGHERNAASTGPITAKLAAAADATAAQPVEVLKLPTGEMLAAKPELALNTLAATTIGLPAQSSLATQAPLGSEYRITTSVGSQHWESAIGNSLVIMTGAGRDRAELVLTPPQLGRIEVSITMKGDDATATFVSANPAVRDALENALPRLREVLADAGITLGQTQIGSGSPEHSAADRQTGDNALRSAAENDSAQSIDTSGNASPLRVISRSLVDTYA